jgi:hypothetical protein
VITDQKVPFHFYPLSYPTRLMSSLLLTLPSSLSELSLFSLVSLFVSASLALILFRLHFLRSPKYLPDPDSAYCQSLDSQLEYLLDWLKTGVLVCTPEQYKAMEIRLTEVVKQLKHKRTLIPFFRTTELFDPFVEIARELRILFQFRWSEWKKAGEKYQDLQDLWHSHPVFTHLKWNEEDIQFYYEKGRTEENAGYFLQMMYLRIKEKSNGQVILWHIEQDDYDQVSIIILNEARNKEGVAKLDIEVLNSESLEFGPDGKRFYIEKFAQWMSPSQKQKNVTAVRPIEDKLF